MTHPSRRARSRAGRWALWMLLAVVIMTQAVSGPVVLAQPDIAAAAPVCDTSPGHDVLCPHGISPAAAPATRGGGRDDAVPAGLLLIVALAVAVPSAGHRPGPAPWAPRRLVSGRHRLAALGITRI